MQSNLRRLPRHAIVTRMKAKRVRQIDVALAVGCAPSYVSWVISRRVRGTELAERVWEELERVLRENAA